MPKSYDMDNKVINSFLRNIAYVPAATVYLALFTTATSPSAPGTEVTGGSYARQPVTFSAPVSGATASSSSETFPNMPAATITHAALMDAAAGGNMLYQGPLLTPVTTTAGLNLVVPVGDVTVTET